VCELFGASSGASRDYSRWLSAIRLRGGLAADNPDGWGVAIWDGSRTAIEKSPEPGWTSGRFLEIARDARSPLVIAHVRKARHPPVPGLVNTHPFAHACCGREWVFAHNGLVPVAADCPSACRPAGETDSESAFCRLLAGIAADYDLAEHGPWIEKLSGVAAAIARSGKFNFLLSDGRLLVAFGHDRLHYRETLSGGASLALVATEPIDDDAWEAFEPGELRAYRDGRLLARHETHPRADMNIPPFTTRATGQGDRP
jgi:glutamine amidotransferase